MLAGSNLTVSLIMPKLRQHHCVLLIIPLFLHLGGCSGLEITPQEPEEKPISVLTGKPQGTPIEELFSQKNSGPGNMPVNALLWRAALDIASFVPLDDVDTFGGSIVTEWYTTEQKPYQRLKLAVFVVGMELRSDAIQVRAYVQIKSSDNKEWITAGRDEQLGRKLEDLILTRARELRAGAVGLTSN